MSRKVWLAVGLILVVVMYLGVVCLLLPVARGQGPDQEVTPVDLHPKRGCRARWCAYLPGVWREVQPTATSQMQ